MARRAWAVVPEIDRRRCAGCGTCVEVCPEDVIRLVRGKSRIIQPDACTYCTECEAACPSDAIRCPFEITVRRAL